MPGLVALGIMLHGNQSLVEHVLIAFVLQSTFEDGTYSADLRYVPEVLVTNVVSCMSYSDLPCVSCIQPLNIFHCEPATYSCVTKQFQILFWLQCW